MPTSVKLFELCYNQVWLYSVMLSSSQTLFAVHINNDKCSFLNVSYSARNSTLVYTVNIYLSIYIYICFIVNLFCSITKVLCIVHFFWFCPFSIHQFKNKYFSIYTSYHIYYMSNHSILDGRT